MDKSKNLYGHLFALTILVYYLVDKKFLSTFAFI